MRTSMPPNVSLSASFPWRTRLRGWLPTILACVLVLAVVAIPLAYISLVTGSFVPYVLPSLQPDTEYYLALIREVLDGNIWLGNPYIKEYAHLQSPSVYLPVWIAAVPGALGLSIQQLALFNLVFFHIVTGMLLYVFLLRVTGNKTWLSALMTSVGVAYVHNWLVRPVIMQTIFPIFLLFLIALEGFLRTEKTRWVIALGLIAVLSFYMYLYLWMVVFAGLGLLTLWKLWNKQWKQVQLLVLMWLGIFLLIFPEALRLSANFSDALSLEVSQRLGVVRTHLVRPVTLFNAKYVMLALVGIVGIHRLRKMSWHSGSQALGIALLAVLLATFSNVVTGVDINLITHLWRLGLLLTASACAWFLAQSGGSLVAKSVSLFCAGLLLLTMGSHIAWRANAFTYLREFSLQQEQQSAGVPLKILEKLPQGVVLAGERLSCSIPVYTHHTVVHCGSAYYHTVPTRELLERYLLQHLTSTNADIIRDGVLSVAGLGATQRAIDANVRNSFCRTTGFCTDDGRTYMPFDMAGGDGAVAEGKNIQRALQKNIPGALERFAVSYIVIDRSLPENPPMPARAKILYEDPRWVVAEFLP